MAMTKPILIALIERGMKKKDLAELCGWTQANLGAKFKRDNFTEDELRKIADVLGMEVEIKLIPKK